MFSDSAGPGNFTYHISEWLILQLIDVPDVAVQLDGSPSHFKSEVREFLNHRFYQTVRLNALEMKTVL